MRQRWTPVAVLAAALFGIDIVARIVVRIVWSKSDKHQIQVGLIAVACVAVVVAVAAFRWASRRPMSRVWSDLVVAIAAGCLLSILLAPFAGGSRPFKEGASFVFSEVWHYFAIAAGGGLLGTLAVMTLGRDWKSQAWKRYTETARAKPRRVVRR